MRGIINLLSIYFKCIKPMCENYVLLLSKATSKKKSVTIPIFFPLPYTICTYIQMKMWEMQTFQHQKLVQLYILTNTVLLTIIKYAGNLCDIFGMITKMMLVDRQIISIYVLSFFTNSDNFGIGKILEQYCFTAFMLRYFRQWWKLKCKLNL